MSHSMRIICSCEVFVLRAINSADLDAREGPASHVKIEMANCDNVTVPVPGSCVLHNCAASHW